MAAAAASDSRLLGGLLDRIDSKWKNWFIRGIFSLIMIGGFSAIIYMGPFVLSLLVSGQNWGMGRRERWRGGRERWEEGEMGKGMMMRCMIITRHSLPSLPLLLSSSPSSPPLPPLSLLSPSTPPLPIPCSLSGGVGDWYPPEMLPRSDQYWLHQGEGVQHPSVQSA